MSAGVAPARASLDSNSFSEKPQSTTTRLVRPPLRDSITEELPPLPLPKLQKRIIGAPLPLPRLFQLVEQHRGDAFAGIAGFSCALAVEHRHHASLAFSLDRDAVARRAAEFVFLAEAEEL